MFFGIQPLVELRLDRFGLGELLRLQAPAFQHVEEIGVATGVELIGTLQADAAIGEQASEAAMNDGGADLALDIVADDGESRIGKFLRPFRIGSDEDRYAIDHRYAGIEAGLRVVLDRLFRSDRQIAEQNVRVGSLQRGRDIGRRQIRRPERFVVRIIGHMGGHAIELRARLDDDIGNRQRALEDARVVRLGEDRLFQRMADLAAVDIEGGDEFDVRGAVAADVLAHHAIQLGIAIGAVVFDALDQ